MEWRTSLECDARESSMDMRSGAVNDELPYRVPITVQRESTLVNECIHIELGLIRFDSYPWQGEKNSERCGWPWTSLLAFVTGPNLITAARHPSEWCVCV